MLPALPPPTIASSIPVFVKPDFCAIAKAIGETVNGLYQGEEYTGGSKFQSFKVSSVLTNVTSSGSTEGTSNDGMMGAGGNHGGVR